MTNSQSSNSNPQYSTLNYQFQPMCINLLIGHWVFVGWILALGHWPLDIETLRILTTAMLNTACS